jgi:hypothetical protein
MTLREFIKKNRQEIDSGISRFYGDNCKPSNDAERQDWILNDEGLYNWAKSEGVKL